MSLASAAEQCLRDGDPAGALPKLQEAVRATPDDAKLRIFLFQLLSVLGQWERALNQLNVAAELDPIALAMAQMYREALHCEVLRAQVFEGKKSPMVFGQPDQWLALLIESLLLVGQGKHREADALRVTAFDEADATSGIIDGQPFGWIADADSRLGPVCEAIINGRYYWVPFSRLRAVTIDAPEDLRDVVWMPAHFQFDNGGESVALIPTRYPDSEKSDDGQLLLARKTIWLEAAPDVYHGLGQRVFASDNGEISLMDIRQIMLGPDAGAASANSVAD
ncbi:type VI secretion system accessory protein TagJ [Nitrosospira briensis]|uniref:type VI secretion system accessory protein TagJ n=1 Tax=Nitrosospira briensis TaxID=35799 RepID=UPI0008E04D96|nr:type VI secretion system accessory protein TagJ [Nitrosospira briensis]SFO11843.1 type VI secretion system protein ImpE [Nitrosospira briensis]